ncbi:MAG TPA: MFS transporter [Ferruginibacter sp.]|nr:MFS transporter [Ferruginibacter sp.]HRN91836.1 MFS transporter [Ferruginibacter sp.]HRO05646.1 MFS transporter [Ferruginibacter sp.]HRO95817.1 MFS transporter [Ferruginibacter sp.]HRP49174.1 MFS transporter [Ferruginibacter sp.]
MESAQATYPQDPYAPLKIPEFRYFIAGRFIYIMGIRMTVTVLGWWMYTLTNSKLALGFVGLSEVIPALSFALYAGHYIDKTEKRKLLLKCVAGYAISIALLALLSLQYFESSYTPWAIAVMVFVVIGITGFIRAFSGPTFSAMISQIVPREMLPNAAAISSGGWLTASIIGHAAGGFSIAFLGIHNTFLLVVILVIAAWILFRKLKPKPAMLKNPKHPWQSVKEGIRHVYQTKELMGALVLDLFAVLFGGAVALVPVFAQDILKIGPIGFGWLNAAADIGAIITVTYLTIKPLKRNQGRILFYAIAGFGCCIIMFALSEVFWLSFAALLLSGCMDGFSVIIRGTILQLKTPDELRGRVAAVNSMFINSSNELGQFESGVAAKLMGTVPAVIFGGCMTLAVVVATWFKAPALRKMQY